MKSSPSKTTGPVVARALTIAGSDSGGCAGIQADLKTFAALGVHGMSVITSVTAQDTQRVHLATDLPVETVSSQIDAVAGDIGVDAAKTGMLSSADIIEAVASKVEQYSLKPLVVDPVMVTTGGDMLIRPGAVEVLKSRLLPLALIVTPNLREAEVLSGVEITGPPALEQAAGVILDLGPGAVIIKGGHGEDPDHAVDFYWDGEKPLHLSAPRIDTSNTHGSGCTFAAALTAGLAQGQDARSAAGRAKEYVTEAIRHSFSLGEGSGPLCHFWKNLL